jgi:hypothetical protein
VTTVDPARAFHEAMVRLYERARDETGYNATRFLQMVSSRGGLAAARQLLGGATSNGFTTLWEKGRLDLSVEFHVLLPRFQNLFSDAERAAARSRLEAHGFDVERHLHRVDVDGAE